MHAFTSNIVEDFMITAAWCSVFATGFLEPLYKMTLVNIPGPFAAFFKQPAISTPPTIRDYTQQ
jgi:hypothetical protein